MEGAHSIKQGVFGPRGSTRPYSACGADGWQVQANRWGRNAWPRGVPCVYTVSRPILAPAEPQSMFQPRGGRSIPSGRQVPWIDGRIPARLAISQSNVPNQAAQERRSPTRTGLPPVKSVTSSHNGLVVATTSVQALSPFRMRRYRKPRGPTRCVLHVEKEGTTRLTPADGFSELQAQRRRIKFSASIGHRARQKLHLGSPSRLDAASSPIMGPPQPATLAIPKGAPSWSK